MVAINYDPIERGYVHSLARPGGNITGIYSRTPEVGAKQLELLHEALPRARRVGVLWSAASLDQLPAIEAAGTRLHLEIESVEILDDAGIDRAFVEFGKKRAEAVLAVGDPINFRERSRIGMLGMQLRVPVCGFPGGAEEGFLLSFGANLNQVLRRAAEYVDKILKGSTPGDLPIEQATKFELVINLKTAKALGITISQALLLRADEVIR
jgi:putative ABC transport system substrate-binding protein